MEDMPKVEKMAKELTGNSGRKRLADISNLPRKLSTTLSQDNNKPRQNSATIKEYIEQLQKENAALIKLVADKNRIIELSGAELHKLRITLQKMQQQNLQLARSNSQMLAELNSGKDRLKDLQHQLGCKNGVLIARKLELEGKGKTKICQTNNVKRMKVSEQEEMGVCIVAERDKDKQCNTGRQKSKSLGPSVKKDQEKGVGDNGRLQARRQSARFKHDELKPSEDLFHTDNVDLPSCPVLDDTMQADYLQLVNMSVKKEDEEGESVSLERSRRLSISRPSREAAKKVQSYKEMNVKVKLRRTE